MTEVKFQQQINSMTFKRKPTTLDIEFLKGLTFDELKAYDYSKADKKVLRAFHEYLVFETKRGIPMTLVAACK